MEPYLFYVCDWALMIIIPKIVYHTFKHMGGVLSFPFELWHWCKYHNKINLTFTIWKLLFVIDTHSIFVFSPKTLNYSMTIKYKYLRVALSFGKCWGSTIASLSLRFWLFTVGSVTEFGIYRQLWYGRAQRHENVTVC